MQMVLFSHLLEASGRGYDISATYDREADTIMTYDTWPETQSLRAQLLPVLCQSATALRDFRIRYGWKVPPACLYQQAAMTCMILLVELQRNLLHPSTQAESSQLVSAMFALQTTFTSGSPVALALLPSLVSQSATVFTLPTTITTTHLSTQRGI
jgi:hypothetical protein